MGRDARRIPRAQLRGVITRRLPGRRVQRGFSPRVYSSNAGCARRRGIFALSKTFFRGNTDVFQGKMARRSVKRPAVRVCWALKEYTPVSRWLTAPSFRGGLGAREDLGAPRPSPPQWVPWGPSPSGGGFLSPFKNENPELHTGAPGFILLLNTWRRRGSYGRGDSRCQSGGCRRGRAGRGNCGSAGRLSAGRPRGSRRRGPAGR